MYLIMNLRMKKNILLIIIFLSQGIMSWGQSDTLSYESIMGYYKSKTNMIEFYQMAGNNDKAAELRRGRKKDKTENIENQLKI